MKLTPVRLKIRPLIAFKLWPNVKTCVESKHFSTAKTNSNCLFVFVFTQRKSLFTQSMASSSISSWNYRIKRQWSRSLILSCLKKSFLYLFEKYKFPSFFLPWIKCLEHYGSALEAFRLIRNKAWRRNETKREGEREKTKCPLPYPSISLFIHFKALCYSFSFGNSLSKQKTKVNKSSLAKIITSFTSFCEFFNCVFNELIEKTW